MLVPPCTSAPVFSGGGCGGYCIELAVPFFDFLHRQHMHTHMHRSISSRRIPPPTPPPIAAATESEVKAESVDEI